MPNDPKLKIIYRLWSITSKTSQNAGEEKYAVTLIIPLVNKRDANKLLPEDPTCARLCDGCFPTWPHLIPRSFRSR